MPCRATMSPTSHGRRTNSATSSRARTLRKGLRRLSRNESRTSRESRFREIRTGKGGTDGSSHHPRTDRGALRRPRFRGEVAVHPGRDRRADLADLVLHARLARLARLAGRHGRQRYEGLRTTVAASNRPRPSSASSFVDAGDVVPVTDWPFFAAVSRASETVLAAGDGPVWRSWIE